MKKRIHNYSIVAVGLSLTFMANAAIAGANELPFSSSSSSSVFNFAPLGSSSSESDSDTVSVDGIKLSTQEARMLELVNQHRADNNLEPLSPSQQLTVQARSWSKVQANKDSMHHSSDNVYENAAVSPVSTTAGVFFELWKESAPHNANMLNPNITTIGYGTAVNDKSGYEYATMQLL